MFLRRNCECPCECPLETDYCPSNRRSSDYLKSSDLPVCDREASTLSQLIDNRDASKSSSALPDCFDESSTACASATAKLDCLSFAGCSWCEAELEPVDNEFSTSSATAVPISKPYCAAMDECPSGVVGSFSPYDLRDAWSEIGAARGRRKMASAVEQAATSLSEQNRPSPVGPVVGGILVFFLFLVFSAFCYRHKLSDEDSACRGAAIFRRGVSRGGGGGRQRVVSNIEVDDEEEELREMQFAVSVSRPLPNPAAAISPYRMNPRYFRPAPAPGTSSDHGYSTMTPTVVNGGGGGSSSVDQDSDVIVPYTASEAARSRMNSRLQQHKASVTSGLSSRASSPEQQQSENSRGRLHTHSEQDASYDEEEEDASFLSECQRNAQFRTNDSEFTVLNPNKIVVAATVHVADTPS